MSQAVRISVTHGDRLPIRQSTRWPVRTSSSPVHLPLVRGLLLLEHLGERAIATAGLNAQRTACIACRKTTVWSACLTTAWRATPRLRAYRP